MVDELKRKYAVALQEGRTEDATRLAQELRSDTPVKSSEVEAVDFTELNGVGSELADELRESFDSFSDLAEADREVLLDISGVGESRADSLIEQSRER
jgi:ERCC4-type nuclease